MRLLRDNDPKGRALLHPAVVLGSGFYSGFAPVMRGTCGSLVAALPAFGLVWLFPGSSLLPAVWAAGAAVFSVLSILAATAVLRRGFAEKDPGWFVMDEFAGLYVTLAIFGAANLTDICVAFPAFRIYDICKPWLVRTFERLPGGTGILADDLAAGVLAGWSCVVVAAI